MWQLRPLEEWMIERHEEQLKRLGHQVPSIFREGIWWVWDIGRYSLDTVESLDPVVGQVYRIEGKQVQIFKVLRVDRLEDLHYPVVQVDFDWYLTKGGKPDGT